MMLGLPILLLVSLVLMYLFRNNKANPINKSVIWLSPYRKLRPYLLAQARLESGDFESNIYNLTNNPLAMNHAYQRDQLGDPEPSGIGEAGSDGDIQVYRNDTQGFRDMFLWFKYTRFPTHVRDAADYVRNLKQRGYFEANEAEYLRGLESGIDTRGLR